MLCVLSCFSRVQLCATLGTVVRQVPLSMGYPRKEYRRTWLPFPSPGDLADSGIEATSLMSPALVARFFITSATQKLYSIYVL